MSASSKAGELHFSALNWLTGIAPVAAGACVLLLIKDEAGRLAPGIAVVVLFLLAGFVFGTLAQFHAVRAMRSSETGDRESGAGRARDLFQILMLVALYGAVLSVCTGALILALRPADSFTTSGGDVEILYSTIGDPDEALVLRHRGDVLVVRWRFDEAAIDLFERRHHPD